MTGTARQFKSSLLINGDIRMKIKNLIAAAILGTAALSSFAATESIQFSYTGSGTVTGFGGTLLDNNFGLTFSGVTLDGSGASVTDPFGDGTMISILTSSTSSNHTLSYSYTGSGTVDTSSFGFTVAGQTSPVVPSSITPVPEPETYAMMLAGLGALGFMGRRRKTQ